MGTSLFVCVCVCAGAGELLICPVTWVKTSCEHPFYCCNLSSSMVLTSQELSYSLWQFRLLTANRMTHSLPHYPKSELSQSVPPAFSSLGLNQSMQVKCLKQCLAHSRYSTNISYYYYSSSLPLLFPSLQFPYIPPYFGQREAYALLPTGPILFRVLCSHCFPIKNVF